MKIRINTVVPPGIIDALLRREWHYTAMKDVFHCIHIDVAHYIGVVGDGENGSYEWFSMKGDELACSDVGFGDTAVALREILNKTAL